VAHFLIRIKWRLERKEYGHAGVCAASTQVLPLRVHWRRFDLAQNAALPDRPSSACQPQALRREFLSHPRTPANSMNILLIYSTIDGHTLQICRRLQTMLESLRYHVTLVALADFAHLDLNAFDKIVVGASIRYGKHRPELVDFLRRNGPLLSARPNAFFTVNLVARKPEKNRPDTNPYMVKLMKQLSWRPTQRAVFAGKIDYPRYGFFDRQIIRFIMWLTDGPTGARDVIDFTDWAQVDEFAHVIDRM
jgi:menaquinone-dependent protoporphyrinogen oxidase